MKDSQSNDIEYYTLSLDIYNLAIVLVQVIIVFVVAVILLEYLETDVSVVLRVKYQLVSVFLYYVVRKVWFRVVWTWSRWVHRVQTQFK